MGNCRKDPFCHLSTESALIELRGDSFENILRLHNENKLPVSLSLPLKGQFDTMIVGESPSFDDMKGNMPFQDESSDLLISFIERAGLNPKRTYATYIVKCKPPFRKPSVKEINTCKVEHLFEEIKAIEPKVIILLGNIAARAFNLHNKGGMTTIHGKVYQLPIPTEKEPLYNVIPTFNPSMFIYRPNPQLQQSVVNDYRNAQMILENKPIGSPQEIKYNLIDTYEKVNWLVDQLNSVPKFACDTESVSLPWSTSQILCMSFCWGYPDKTAVLPFMHHDKESENAELFYPPESKVDIERQIYTKWCKTGLALVLNKLAVPFRDSGISKIFHNYKYDANVIRQWLGIGIQGFIYDTMVLHHLLQEEGSHKLEDLADEEFEYGDYSEPIRRIVGHGKKLLRDYGHIPDEILWPYASLDAESTWRLENEKYTHRLRAKPSLWKLYCEESEPLLKALVKAEWWGHKIDTNVVDTLEQEYTQRQDVLLTEMRGLTNPTFNPLSHPQVKQAFFDMGLAHLILDDRATSGIKADKSVLADIQDDVPLASKLLEYRTNRKLLSTYLQDARDHIEADGRIRHSWYPLTVTGRLSCRFFHQIPKTDPYRIQKGLLVMRDMFIVEPGYTMVYGDYSQVELRILAIKSRDQEMLRIMDDHDQDLHAATTYEFIRKVWTGYTEEMARKDKFNRAEVGKRINFGLAYGSQGHALVKTGKWQDWDGVIRSFTWDMLNEGMIAWKRRFPGVGQYLEDVPEAARRCGGIVYNCFGRERRLGGRLNLASKAKRGDAEREAVNFPIQSAAGGLTNRTISMMDRVIDRAISKGEIEEGHVKLINTVHDSIAYEVKDELVEWFVVVLKQIGERQIPELDYQTFEMDIGVGHTWTTAEGE